MYISGQKDWKIILKIRKNHYNINVYYNEKNMEWINPEDWRIEGIMMDWNKNHKNKIDITPENIEFYKKWWTLSEIQQGKEIFWLVKDNTHCPWAITYIPNED